MQKEFWNNSVNPEPLTGQIVFLRTNGCPCTVVAHTSYGTILVTPLNKQMTLDVTLDQLINRKELKAQEEAAIKSEELALRAQKMAKTLGLLEQTFGAQSPQVARFWVNVAKHLPDDHFTPEADHDKK